MSTMRLTRVAAAAALLFVMAATPACAQSQEVEALRRELEALKLQQAQMAEELRRLQQAMGVRATALSLGTSPSRGRADAPLVLVEFSDYECPFCIRHFTQTMPEIEREYISTGKLRYVFMDYPIDQLHPAALKAHEAARCSGEQGKFWEMHNRLFTPAGSHGVGQLKALASELGLDRGKFDTCLDSGRMAAPVRASVDKATQLGADGTPQMYLGVADANGGFKIIRSIRGAVPYPQIKQAIDALLAPAGSSSAAGVRRSTATISASPSDRQAGKSRIRAGELRTAGSPTQPCPERSARFSRITTACLNGRRRRHRRCRRRTHSRASRARLRGGSADAVANQRGPRASGATGSARRGPSAL